MKLPLPLSIGTKISGAFLILILILLTLVWLSHARMQSIRDLVARQVVEKADVRDKGKDIVLRAEHIFNLVDEYLASSSFQRRLEITASLDDESRAIEQTLQQFNLRVLARDERHLVDVIQVTFQRYRTQMYLLLQSYHREGGLNQQTVRLADEYTGMQSQLITLLLELDILESKHINASWGEALDAIKAMQRYLIVFGLTAVLVSIVLVVLMTRGITRPIANLVDVLERYGGGDHTVRAEVMSRDEIGFLARRFNLLLEQIQDAQQRIADIIEFLPDATFVIDTQGKVIAWNRATEEMTGVPKEDIIGKSDYAHARPFYGEPRPLLADLVLREDPATERKYLSFERKGDTVYGESFVPCLHAGRGGFTWNIASPLFSRGHIVGAIESMRDITDRKQAEEAVRESERRLADIIDFLPDATFAIDRHGTIIAWNRAMEELTGYSAAEMIGKGDYEYAIPFYQERRPILIDLMFVGPEDVPSRYAFIRREKDIIVGETDVPFVRGKKRFLSGRVAPLYNIQGELVGAIESIRDLTEAKRAERALHDSEERYRNILENITDGYYEFDLNGNITFFNPSFLGILGYSASQARGLDFRRIMEPATAERIEHLFRRVYQTGVPVQCEEGALIRADGEKVLFELSILLIRDEHGAPSGFRGLLHDITQRKHLEAQLLQGHKMEAIGTLAGGIAHEFNNLLMGIQGHVSLMLLENDPRHPHHDRLLHIQEQVSNGADLTRQLLGFAQEGQYELKATNLNDLIEKSAALFGRTRKEILIHKKYARDLWVVECDQGQMEQVLLNLMVNAWQAMPNGGQLFLETRNVRLDESAARPFQREPGDYVQFSVTDTGLGMDDKTKARIFEPFFTTRAMGHGTGLGLASAYGIISAHRGIITVQSEQGRGSTFTISLPVSRKVVEKTVAPREAIQKGQETVLLVDDEPVVLEVSMELLQMLGYRVVTATSGREAVETYARQKDDIALVILDMIMPDMGGGATYDALRGINPDIRVILASGYILDGTVREILERGCRAFIHKPFTIHELSRKVREVLDQNADQCQG